MEGAPGGAVEQIVALLLSLGLPGVIIIALGFAYYKKDQRVSELQGTLIEMSKEQGKAVAEATASINRISDLILRGKAE